MVIILISFFINAVIALILYKYQKFVNYFNGIVTSLISLSGLILLILNYFFNFFNFKNNYIALDNLSIFFLFLIFLGSIFFSLYGINYLTNYYSKKNLGVHWALINILIASMSLVVMSKNVILFLIAWEIMSFSSFFLVLFEGEKKEVVRASFIYIVATHIGTIFLFVMFLLYSKEYSSFDMSQWGGIKDSLLSSIIFIFALIGFGTKAGIMPMHIWLPEAHPAAPSHISAMMSGIMIKNGIYGILRILFTLKDVQIWWGYLLIIMGVISGFLGILFAVSQHDIKRMLAYSSIENIGIIVIGIGLGIIGLSLNNSLLILLGFCGALLHVFNHLLFKGLLFMGAGSVYFATHSRNIDSFGGLLKRMPLTGVTFLIGSLAISSLPPFNGFMSEFLLYFGFFNSILTDKISFVILSCFGIIFMAIIGALALISFTKLFGIVFLGELRDQKHSKAKDPPFLMVLSMIIFAIFNVIIALGFPFIIKIAANILGIGINFRLTQIFNILAIIVIVFIIFYIIVLLLILKRRILLINKKIDYSLTWDCGYAKPDARMQYTGSSFVQPVTDFFRYILRTERTPIKVIDCFPDNSKFKTKTKDFFTSLFTPLIELIKRINNRLTLFQYGYLHLYILYIFIALIILLIWKL